MLSRFKSYFIALLCFVGIVFITSFPVEGRPLMNVKKTLREGGSSLASGLLLSGVRSAIALGGSENFPAEPPAKGVSVIKDVRIVYGDGSTLENATVTIVGDTIDSVIVRGPVHPEAVRVINGKGKTAIPGLIDAHVHLFPPDLNFPPGTTRGKNAEASRFSSTLRRAFLQRGVTTVRSMGDPVDLIQPLKQQIDDYILGGPTIYYAGKMITAPGGHPVALYPPEIVAETIAEVETISEAESVVEEMHAKDAQVIKVIYGSVTLSGTPVPQLKEEILRAIVKKAHNFSPPMMVTTHIETLRGAEEAILAGVDAIEHIPGNAERLAQLAGDRGIFITPTLRAPFGMLPPEVFATLKKTMQAIYQDGRTMIVTGTDYPFAPAGIGLFEEMELMRNCGMAPVDILKAATINAARSLGQGYRLGAILPGRIADIVLLECDPLKDITCLRDENKIVIQKGRVVFE